MMLANLLNNNTYRICKMFQELFGSVELNNNDMDVEVLIK